MSNHHSNKEKERIDRRHRHTHLVSVLVLLMILAGCSTVPQHSQPQQSGHRNVSRTPDAIPKPLPLSRYGNPPVYEVFGKRYYTLKSSSGFVEEGIASWYGPTFHGKRTSSGETYDMYQMTAAHPTLPLPTFVEVTNLENGRKTIVKVNDRGPFYDDRIIDLSYAAAYKLGVDRPGTAHVQIRAIEPRQQQTARVTQLSATQATQRLQQTRVKPTPSNSPPSFAQFPPAPQSGVYVQVGAYSELGRAQTLRNQITETISQHVRVNPTVERATKLYRVQVGPFSDSTQAGQVIPALNKLGFNQLRLVIN